MLAYGPQNAGNRPKRPIAKTASMKVENGPRKPKRPRPKRPQWKKKTRPKRPQLTSKTAHYVTLYKYRINDIIKSTWGIPYKRVDAAAVIAAHNKRTTGMRNLLRYSLLRRCFHDMKGGRPRSFNLFAGVFESIQRSTHIRMRLVCGSRSASFSCCEDNAVRKLLMLTSRRQPTVRCHTLSFSVNTGAPVNTGAWTAT